MKLMKITSAVAVLLSVGFLGNLSLADSEGIIKYRKNVMKTNAGHMGAIMDILKNHLPLETHVVDHAGSINQNSKMILSMFPKGSDLGDTKAKPAIWKTGLNLKPHQRPLCVKAPHWPKSQKAGTSKLLQNKSEPSVKLVVDATNISRKENRALQSIVWFHIPADYLFRRFYCA